MTDKTQKRRVGIVGFGKLGQYLFQHILSEPLCNQLEVAFIWNRTIQTVKDFPSVQESWILEDLSKFESFNADIIVEVSHPDIIKNYGAQFLSKADLFVGSPTAFADLDTEKSLRDISSTVPFGVYIPAGAMWGAEDVAKMATSGSLKGLKVTMKKHPESLKVLPPLDEKIKASVSGVENIIFEGSVRDLAPLAPNNVNTMACAALAASNLGFDQTKACLVADDRLDSHIILIEVIGPYNEETKESFHVITERKNPSPPGSVTGQQTFVSFLSSLKRSYGRGKGFHFC